MSSPQEGENINNQSNTYVIEDSGAIQEPKDVSTKEKESKTVGEEDKVQEINQTEGERYKAFCE